MGRACLENGLRRWKNHSLSDDFRLIVEFEEERHGLHFGRMLGEREFEVRVDLPSHRDAVEFAERLEAEV